MSTDIVFRMYEINIKLKHDCPYLKIANMFDFSCYSFCSEIYDLMTFPTHLGDDEIEAIKPYISDMGSLEIIRGNEQHSVTHLYFRCMCRTDTSISPKIQKYGGMVEHPVIYKEGWEHYKIICLNEKSQSSVLQFIQTIPEYELISIKDLGREGIFKSHFVSMHQLLSTLTDKQVEVIVKAYEQGYYEIPRTVRTQELAEDFGVSRAATEKSLRKAENRIISTIIPYLTFHQKIHSQENNPRKIEFIE